MHYKHDIQRSKRTTVSLSILEDSRLLIRAPLSMPDMEIESIVEKHTRWIEKNLIKMEQKAKKKAEFGFLNGQMLPFLGIDYPIAQGVSKKAWFDGEAFYMPDGDRTKPAAQWYRKRAKEIIEVRVEAYSRRMGVKPSGIKITSAKTRWGSCSASNALCFSYRLLCVPSDALDSVVVHELAHIKTKNHSPKFYREIEKAMPDYRERHKKLKEYAQKIPF
ncbi:MAG: M48 family metallopeptidase [Christensenellales bacterium]